MAAGHHVGEDPAVTRQFLVLGAAQHRHAKSHLGESVEQFGILDQRGALIEKILSLEDAAAVNAAVDADHQVERQFEVAAELRQHPKPLLALWPGLEVRRQRNGTGPRSPLREVLEQLAEGLSQRSCIPNLETCRLRQPLSHLGLVEVEDQLVSAQTGDVARRVEAVERVVEVIGQKDLLQPRAPRAPAPPNRAGP